MEVILRQADHGDTLLNGYPGTRSGRVPGYLSTRAPGPKNPAGFGTDPDPVIGRTRPGKHAGYPGPTRTGGTPTTHAHKLAPCSCSLLPLDTLIPPTLVSLSLFPCFCWNGMRRYVNVNGDFN